jgi:hypothetical protein
MGLEGVNCRRSEKQNAEVDAFATYVLEIDLSGVEQIDEEATL